MNGVNRISTAASNALPPRELKRIVERALASVIDTELMKATIARKKEGTAP